MNFTQLLEKSRTETWLEQSHKEIFEWCSFIPGRKSVLPFALSARSSLRELRRLAKEVELGDIHSSLAFTLAIANAGFLRQVMRVVLEYGTHADSRDFAYRQSSLFEIVQMEAELSALIAWITGSFTDLAKSRGAGLDSLIPVTRAILAYSQQVLRSVSGLVFTLETQEPIDIGAERFRDIAKAMTVVFEINRAIATPVNGDQASVNIVSRFLGIE